MNMMKTTLFCALLMTTAGVWAQTETTIQQAQKPITPYGKNPNILHVWAYKTQEGVINTAEKSGLQQKKASKKFALLHTKPWTVQKPSPTTPQNKPKKQDSKLPKM